MAKTCILFLISVIGAFGQTSADLSAKYPHFTAYEITPDLLMTPKFAADGQVCEMAIEKRHLVDNSFRTETLFSSNKEVRDVGESIVPEKERGRNLNGIFDGTVSGSVMTAEYTYENVKVVAYGDARPYEDPATYGKDGFHIGRGGYPVIIITWTKRPCGKAQAEANAK